MLVLKLGTAGGGHFGLNSTVYVDDGRVVINTPGKGSEIVLLENRTLGDVVNALQSKYPDLVVSTDHALKQAGILAETTSARQLTTSGVTLTADPEAPAVNLGFGVVMSMTDNTESESEGLLSQTGFQLDLAGIHQLVGTGTSWWTLKSAVYVQGRLGLNADQQLAVEQETEASPLPDAAGQFEAALEQADQVALTGQLDLVWPLGALGRQTEFSGSFGYGISWTQLGDFSFPEIPVNDSIRPAESLFDNGRLELARNFLNQTLPLSDFSVMGLFRFRRSDRPLFYLGGGIARKEVVRRGIRFQRDSTGIPRPLSLRGEVTTEAEDVWRAVFGARIAGLLDVRVDAVGPIGARNAEPLLRIVLGRDFPVTR